VYYGKIVQDCLFHVLVLRAVPFFTITMTHSLMSAIGLKQL